MESAAAFDVFVHDYGVTTAVIMYALRELLPLFFKKRKRKP